MNKHLYTVKTLQATFHSLHKRYGEAVREYSKLIRLKPEYGFVWAQRGLCYQLMNEDEKAIRDFNMAILAVPKFYEAYIERSYVLIRMKRDREAIPGLIAAIQISPGISAAYNNLGRVYADLSITDSAIYFLNKAVAINPMMAQAWFNLGEVYYGKDKNKEAAQCFTKCIDLGERSAFVYVSKGNAYYFSSQYDSAIADYEKAFKMTDRYAYALGRLGDCYYEKQQYLTAIDYFDRSLAINPEPRSVIVSKALAYSKIGKLSVSYGLLFEVMQKDSTYAHCTGNLGWICYLRGNFADCIRYSEMAIRHDSTAWYARYNIALSWLRLGEIEKAEKLYFKFTATQKAENKEVNPGAITDLKDLIKEEIMVEESKRILTNVFKVKL